ncbi:hypothetical protein BpHYR1_028158 [Brachionus plicatilis]|uniref:Uncharacterized protein n=1 Tax=Brachionus plicatilis TaxID=10195 RepID=A0A3M7QDQ0_BRAPC|nr:hypothetical protein BpHYR1_028158 [Brachionus plicatilis]
MKGQLYKTYIRPILLYGIEAFHLNQGDINGLKRFEGNTIDIKDDIVSEIYKITNILDFNPGTNTAEACAMKKYMIKNEIRCEREDEQVGVLKKIFDSKDHLFFTILRIFNDMSLYSSKNRLDNWQLEVHDKFKIDIKIKQIMFNKIKNTILFESKTENFNLKFTIDHELQFAEITIIEEI